MQTFLSFQQLGPLEQKILEDVWARGNATVPELHKASDRYAYTTIMTTLDRLSRKGLLKKGMEGRKFRYWPVFTKDELQKFSAVQVLREVFTRENSSYHSLLSHVVETVGDEDPKLLDELQALIEQKRRARTA